MHLLVAILDFFSLFLSTCVCVSARSLSPSRSRRRGEKKKQRKIHHKACTLLVFYYALSQLLSAERERERERARRKSESAIHAQICESSRMPTLAPCPPAKVYRDYSVSIGYGPMHHIAKPRHAKWRYGLAVALSRGESFGLHWGRE